MPVRVVDEPMPKLSSREKRAIRIGVALVAIYLSLFYGIGGWKKLEAARADYIQLERQAQRMSREMRAYENRVLLLEKLKDEFRMDPSSLSRATLVGEISAAIQRTAKSGGVKLGPIRESPGSASAWELAAMQLEGQGPVQSVMLLLHQIENLGYPLILESIQITPQPQPGTVKLNLQLVVLDYEQWKGKSG
jgi:hypothetical protein